MARFTLTKSQAPRGVVLHDHQQSYPPQETFLYPDDARELRDLLSREFPVESPAPAQPDEPDPDEVRRACNYYEDPAFAMDPMAIGMRPALAAARAWLSLREQQQPVGCFRCNERTHNIRAFCDACAKQGIAATYEQQPAQPGPAPLSIEQVIEACGVTGDWRVSVNRCERGFGAHIITGCDTYWYSAVGDTPEAAIRQLGQDAIAKFRAQRERADSALRKLGVES